MIWLLAILAFLLTVTCLLISCAMCCAAFRNCIDEWETTFWHCVNCCTKKRATVVHPVMASEVTYLGNIDIENG